MVLVVHEYGASVGKRGNCILVKTKSGSTELCADKVTALQLYPASSITSDAVRLCIEKDIQIVFMEYHQFPSFKQHRVAQKAVYIGRI